MTRPLIWVDCDGVLANFTASYLSILTALTGRVHTRAEVTDFEFAKCVASETEDAKVWSVVDSSPGLVHRLDWIVGAREGLAALREIGDVKCLTSPHIGPTWMHERCKWLMDRGFTKKEIVFCSDKPLIYGDMLIEDNLETANAWDDATGGHSVLIDAPYNQGKVLGYRAPTWEAITSYAMEVFT